MDSIFTCPESGSSEFSVQIGFTLNGERHLLWTCEPATHNCREYTAFLYVLLPRFQGADSSITRPAADFRSAVVEPHHHDRRDERNTA